VIEVNGMIVKIVVIFLFSINLFAQNIDFIAKESIKSILVGNGKNLQNNVDKLLIMEIPGFPGKPVELSWIILIEKSRNQKSLFVQYWTIPATTKEDEDLMPFLEKGIATHFSDYPTARFKINKHNDNVLQLIENEGKDFMGVGVKKLDSNSYLVGILHDSEIFIYGQECNFDSKIFKNLLQEIDLWLVPHRKKLLKRTIDSLFGD